MLFFSIDNIFLKVNRQLSSNLSYYAGSYELIVIASDGIKVSSLELKELKYEDSPMTYKLGSGSDSGGDVSGEPAVIKLKELSIGDQVYGLTVTGIVNHIQGDSGDADIRFSGRIQLSGLLEMDDMYEVPVFITDRDTESVIIDLSDENSTEVYHAKIPGELIYFTNDDVLTDYLTGLGIDLSEGHECTIEVNNPEFMAWLNSEGGLSAEFIKIVE